MLTQLGDLVVPASVVSAATPKAASGGAGGGAGAGGGYAGAKAQPSDAQLLRAAAAKRRKELEESKVGRGGIRGGSGCSGLLIGLRGVVVGCSQYFTTPAMRELKRLKRQAVYKTCLVRVNFPDRGMVCMCVC